MSTSFFECGEMFRIGHVRVPGSGGIDKDISELAKEGKPHEVGWLFQGDGCDIGAGAKISIPLKAGEE
jgi:hypothetical protein